MFISYWVTLEKYFCCLEHTQQKYDRGSCSCHKLYYKMFKFPAICDLFGSADFFFSLTKCLSLETSWIFCFLYLHAFVLWQSHPHCITFVFWKEDGDLVHDVSTFWGKLCYDGRKKGWRLSCWIVVQYWNCWRPEAVDAGDLWLGSVEHYTTSATTAAQCGGSCRCVVR